MGVRLWGGVLGLILSPISFYCVIFAHYLLSMGLSGSNTLFHLATGRYLKCGMEGRILWLAVGMLG